ncbi:MAG TPA: MarR family transcriptional regulator [Thermomicrobiales bacterium]|nr:MarR family transcriptional regulator [Thermomicrobiales bacterium]
MDGEAAGNSLSARQKRLSQLMVLILPDFGRWINQIRDFQTPYGKAGIRQLDVLYHLRHGLLENSNPTSTEMAQHFQIQRSVLTRIVAKLESGGFVTRECDLADRRAWRVTITEQGKLLSDYVQQQIFEEMRSALGDLTENDLASLERAMQLLVGVASNLHQTPIGQLVDRHLEQP